MIEGYLGKLNRALDTMHLTPLRLKHVRAICAQLMDFFDGVDNLSIPLVDYEDCVKAQKGKLEMRQKIVRAISLPSTYTTIHQL